MEASSQVSFSSYSRFHHGRKSTPGLGLVRPPCWSIPPKLGMKLVKESNSRRLSIQVNCAKWDSSEPSLGSKLKRDVEEGEAGIEEEWVELIGELVREKCKEGKGVVELLQCLEKEAIMGDDQGKDPTDYNRRALIFDKSSKIFKALKEREAASNHPS